MKRIVVLCLCISCSILTTAQSVIPKFGVTQSSVQFSKDLKGDELIESRTGFVVGFGIEFKIAGGLNIQPELLYHQKGWVSESATAQRRESYRLDYFELPVMIKYKFSVFHLNAGPFVAYGYSGNYKYTETTSGQVSKGAGMICFGKAPSKNLNDAMYLDNNIDYGLQMGFGVMAFKKIVFDMRYSLSYASFYENRPGNNTSRNNGFQLTIGFPSH
jgi:hypothetical protein